MRNLAALGFGLALAAWAVPVAADQVITVTLGKHHPLKLDRRAAAVFIGKPEIVDYVGFRSDHFFLLGQALGETSLLILDGKDKEILKAHVVVVPETDRHVTINRSGKGQKEGISEEVLSCPERCSSVSASGSSAAKPGAGGKNGGNDADMGGPAGADSGSGSPAANAAKELSGK